MRCPAVYILYNPDIQLLEQSLDISSRLFAEIYLVDNTENISIKSEIVLLLRHYDNINYCDMKGNKGIAYALNYSCRKAIDHGYNWCVFFDQDTIPPSNLLHEYSTFIDTTELKVGIICPQYSNSYKDKVYTMDGYEHVPAAITSGSCVNLKAFLEVHGFKDELFIDAVDTEYSWNVRVHGFDIIRLNSVCIKHEIGDNCYDVKFLGRRLMTIDNHNHIRCYYIVRNSIVIRRQYKDLLPDDARKYKKMAKLIIKVLLFENDKFRKLRFIYYGYKDATQNKLGKCNHD